MELLEILSGQNMGNCDCCTITDLSISWTVRAQEHARNTSPACVTPGGYSADVCCDTRLRGAARSALELRKKRATPQHPGVRCSASDAAHAPQQSPYNKSSSCSLHPVKESSTYTFVKIVTNPCKYFKSSTALFPLPSLAP